MVDCGQLEAAQVLSQDSYDPAHQQSSWSCIHCAEFFEKLDRFDQVTKHVKDQ